MISNGVLDDPVLGSLPKQNNIIQQPLISSCLGFKECVCKMKQTDLPSFPCEQLLKWLWDSWMLTSKMLVSLQPRHKVLRIQLRILVHQKELRGEVHFQFKSELCMCQDVPSFWQIPGQIAREMPQMCHKLSWERRRTATLSAAPATTATQLQISVPTHLVAVRPPTSAQHLIANTTDIKHPWHGPREPKMRTRLSFVLVDAFGISIFVGPLCLFHNSDCYKSCDDPWSGCIPANFWDSSSINEDSSESTWHLCDTKVPAKLWADADRVPRGTPRTPGRAQHSVGQRIPLAQPTNSPHWIYGQVAQMNGAHELGWTWASHQTQNGMQKGPFIFQGMPRCNIAETSQWSPPSLFVEKKGANQGSPGPLSEQFDLSKHDLNAIWCSSAPLDVSMCIRLSQCSVWYDASRFFCNVSLESTHGLVCVCVIYIYIWTH